jgi:hypothetical protein
LGTAHLEKMGGNGERTGGHGRAVLTEGRLSTTLAAGCRPTRHHLSPHLGIICLASLMLFLGDIVKVNLAQPAVAGALQVEFSHPSGHYDRSIVVSMTSAHPGATIRFTTDGSIPAPTSDQIYSEPLHLPADPASVVTIRARAFLPGSEPGPVASASYFMGLQTVLPLVSIIIDPQDLWEPNHGIFAQPEERGAEWERPVEVFFLDQDKRSGFYTPAGVRVHGGVSRRRDKKSLRLYFRQEYGNPLLEYLLFKDSGVQTFKRLVLHAGGQDVPSVIANATLMRTQLLTELSASARADAPSMRPAILFINGELWGIYYLRERLDRYFLDGHYDIGSAEWLGGSAREPELIEGELAHWENLVQFVESHDLKEPANFAYLQTQMDVDNFVDYNILQVYAANGDWPQANDTRFRPVTHGGRWHWLFWDVDFTFGLGKWSRTELDMMEWLLDSPRGDTQYAAFLQQALFQNPDFRTLFLSRATDLLNTVLTPGAVLTQIDGVAAQLEPDLLFETYPWPNSGDWRANVEYLRDFARRRPELVRQHIANWLDLPGTIGLTINPPADDAGIVAVNSVLLERLPWQGVVFQETGTRLTAVPKPGYSFAGWSPADLPQTAVITLTINVTQTITPRFAPAPPEAPRAGDVLFTGFGEGWFELCIMRPGGVDLRGWRVTDNDTKTARDEGSLIFGQHPALAHVPQGTLIRISLPESPVDLPEDDLEGADGRLHLYAGNGHLDTEIDPWFHLGLGDSLALLAPGPTASFDDDQGIAFTSLGNAGGAVTPNSFGILQDGVTDEG